jgi:hypothetical protein
MKVSRLMSVVKCLEMAVTELRANQISLQRNTNPEDSILVKRLKSEIESLKNDIGEIDIK